MTIEEAARQHTLHDDCGTCAKQILVLIYDLGYPKWAAQQSAHEWHTGGHKS